MKRNKLGIVHYLSSFISEFDKSDDRMSQKSDYVRDYFAFNRWILMFGGLWRPNFRSRIQERLYTFYSILSFLFMNVWFTLSEFISIKDTYTNLDFLIKNINFALTHFMGALKFVFWFTKGHELIAILTTLESDEFHYENAENFDPGAISKQYKKIGFKYTFSFFSLAYLTVSSSYLPPLIATLSQDGKVGKQRLPYFSWIPFEYDTRGRFLLAMLFQCVPVFHYAYCIVGMDTLFMNIMNYVAGHLFILDGAIRSLRIRCVAKTKEPYLTVDSLHNSEQLEGFMVAEMKKCIKHLQTVIGVCDKLEDLHKYLTLIQVLATLFILCTSLFLVSTTPVASPKFANECVYMVAMGFQLTLYCWFGNEVTLKGLDLTNAFWESDWLQSSRSYRKMMLITMIRMKKPLYLTAGKFAPLTLVTFVAIIKASYSFFAVLKKVDD